MEYTLAGSICPKTSVHPAVHNDAVDGTVIDTKGYCSATFMLNFGAITANSKIELLAADAIDADGKLVGGADILPEELFGDFKGTYETTDGNKFYWMGYFGKKRYLQVKFVSGTANFAGTVLMGHPEQTPTLGPKSGAQFVTTNDGTGAVSSDGGY